MLKLYSVISNSITDIICLRAVSCKVKCHYSEHLDLINYICCNEISVCWKAIKNNLHLIIYMKTAVVSGIAHWIIVCHEVKDKESAPAYLWLHYSFSRRQHFTWNTFCCGWFQQGISILSSTLVKTHHRSTWNGWLVFCLHAFCKPAATFFNYFPYLLWNSFFTHHQTCK